MGQPALEVSPDLRDLLALPDTSVLGAFLVPSVLAVSKVTRATEALPALSATLGQLVQEAYQGQEDSPALPADLVPLVPLVSQARAVQSALEVSSVPGAPPDNRVIKVSFIPVLLIIPPVHVLTSAMQASLATLVHQALSVLVARAGL